MRIVVTGNLGYLGTVLTPMLQRAGHEVRGIDVGLYRASAFRPLPPIETLTLDVRDIERDHLAGADAVVHLAALSNDPVGDLAPDVTHAINHHAAVRVAECARAAGVTRLIAASTCSVYGSAGHDWVDESTEPRPVTPYAASKADMERDLRAMHAPGFDVWLPRFATAFGPSPMLRFDLVVNNLTAWAAATGELRLKSDGSAHRPLIHTHDIAASIAAMLTTPASTNPIVNIGAPACTTTIADLARELARELNGPGRPVRVTASDDASRDPRSYRVRFDRMRQVLPAFTPAHTIADAARAIDAMLRETPAETHDFEGPRFARVAHLRALIAEGKLDPELRLDPGPRYRA